jgi:hypothetical protein
MREHRRRKYAPSADLLLRSRSQAQGLGSPVHDSLGLAAQHLAAGELRPGAQAQPGSEVLDAGESCHVRADLRDDLQRGGDVDAVDAREVHAAHLTKIGVRSPIFPVDG